MNTSRVTVSVPGKVHLMGEHAVVYGKPALLSAINLRLHVTVSRQLTSTGGSIHIESSEPTDHVRFAVRKLLEQLKISDCPPLDIVIRSDIPAGLHLGSSAAVAVALSGALLYFCKKLWNPMKINELAYEIEKKQHGNPSGGDNTAVTVGGFVWYRKELEFLRSIWQLPFKSHPSLNHFFLINTGRPAETTGEMVAFVKEEIDKAPDRMQKLLDLNEQQVKRITVALKEGNERELIEAIRVGEKTLEGMGAVSQKVLPFMREIEAADGGVKILGGGGRKDGVGFLLCYHHDAGKIAELARPYSYTVKEIALDGEGIRLEQKD